MTKSQSPLRGEEDAKRWSVKRWSQVGLNNSCLRERQVGPRVAVWMAQCIWYSTKGCRPSCQVWLQMLAIGIDTSRQNVILIPEGWMCSPQKLKMLELRLILLVLLFFKPSVHIIPREILKKLKSKYKIGYDHQSVQSVAGKLSCKRTALKRCTKIEIL